MVIFHSYVKLPEGTWGIFGSIEVDVFWGLGKFRDETRKGL